MAKQEKPFNKIMLTHQRLRLFVGYGEAALEGQTPQEFAADTLECFDILMDFRNIVNRMASLDEDLSDAVMPYLKDEAIKAAAERIAA